MSLPYASAPFIGLKFINESFFFQIVKRKSFFIRLVYQKGFTPGLPEHQTFQGGIGAPDKFPRFFSPAPQGIG